MKEIECKSGNKYGLAVAFGILSELEGAIFEVMDDDAMEEFKKALQDKDESEIKSANIEIFKMLSGKSLRSFITANNKQAPSVIAKTIRTFNDKSVGESYDERLVFVNEELEYDDGVELFEYINGMVDTIGGKLEEQQEKSGPSSMKRGKKAEEASPRS